MPNIKENYRLSMNNRKGKKYAFFSLSSPQKFNLGTQIDNYQLSTINYHLSTNITPPPKLL